MGIGKWAMGSLRLELGRVWAGWSTARLCEGTSTCCVQPLLAQGCVLLMCTACMLVGRNATTSSVGQGAAVWPRWHRTQLAVLCCSAVLVVPLVASAVAGDWSHQRQRRLRPEPLGRGILPSRDRRDGHLNRRVATFTCFPQYTCGPSHCSPPGLTVHTVKPPPYNKHPSSSQPNQVNCSARAHPRPYYHNGCFLASLIFCPPLPRPFHHPLQDALEHLATMSDQLSRLGPGGPGGVRAPRLWEALARAALAALGRHGGRDRGSSSSSSSRGEPSPAHLAELLGGFARVGMGPGGLAEAEEAMRGLLGRAVECAARQLPEAKPQVGWGGSVGRAFRGWQDANAQRQRSRLARMYACQR